MVKADVKITNDGIIPESSSYFEAKADSIVTVGTNIGGDQIMTLIFLNNYPVVEQQEGMLTVSKIEKRRIASITIGQNQAKQFYESLKSVFCEDE